MGISIDQPEIIIKIVFIFIILPAHVYTYNTVYNIAGADPGFQVMGAHLKKLRENFGVFRVINCVIRIYMCRQYNKNKYKNAQ
jgi:alkylated DNA nucleotide flippase Atl1